MSDSSHSRFRYSIVFTLCFICALEIIKGEKTLCELKDVIVNGDLEEEPAPTGETSAPLTLKNCPKMMLNHSGRQSNQGLVVPKKLPSTSWNQIALIMINKPDIDEIDIDDLYNNLRVYEDELKRSSGSNSASQNLAFLSSENTSCTNERYLRLSLAQPTNQSQLGRLRIFSRWMEMNCKVLILRWQVAYVTVSGKEGILLEGGGKADTGRNQGRDLMVDNELEKVVKERDELKDKIAKWEESTRNLDEILNSQMSARDKTGLGYGTHLNELSSNHETDSENSLSIFEVRSSDEENTPENDRFSKNGNKINEYKQRSINTKTSETAGQINDANIEKPKSASELVVSNPKIGRDRVIIEDWNSDDEEKVNEVQTVRPETQIVKTRVDKIGQIF
ncbi:hypothetical protein Tco_0659682 [Tanacetum coccineum]